MYQLPLMLVVVAVAFELPANEAVRPVKVAEVSGYCEGCVTDAEGNVYFSVCGSGEIMKLTPDGKLAVWAKVPAPNGHKILPSGEHLVCDAAAHAVLKLDPNGKRLEPAAETCAGQPLRGPNDLTLDLANGGFYFTDPGGSGRDRLIGTIHYVDRQGRCTQVADGLAFPNGIVLRPGGKELLVAESQKNRILAYLVSAPGELGPMRVFAELPQKEGEQIDNQPDGICLDESGNLYVAHYGMKQVQVLSPEGKLLRRYAGGNLTTSNVCFAGPNFDQLYVTGGLTGEGGSKGGLFRLDLVGVKGLRILSTK